MRNNLQMTLMLMLSSVACVQADELAAPTLQLVEVRKLWDAAPHNAFTDLIRFKDRWYCAFREGQGHVSPDGKLRVLMSEDGEKWKSVALLDYEGGDARDPKLSTTPDGRLMLNGAVAWHQPHNGHTHQSLVWFSGDGLLWSEATEIGEPDFWIWSVTWHDGVAYGVGYGCTPDLQLARLYSSTDGKKWTTLLSSLFPAGGWPDEASLVFTANDTCYCLLRRETEGQAGYLGTAQPPYKEWKWKSVGQFVGGPKMIELPDGRLLAAARLLGGGEHTSLFWLDRKTGELTEALPLPSGGDASYAGMVFYDGLVWVSYYSSHEDKTSIYLAKVRPQ